MMTEREGGQSGSHLCYFIAMSETDFKAASVIVVGDAMVDKYLIGRVRRLSPEAPVPIVEVGRTVLAPGGCANVANNVVHLRARAHLVCAAGRDAGRADLERMLGERKIDHTLIDAGLPTTTKVRVIGDRQQMIRLDFEEVAPIDDASTEGIAAAAEALMAGAGVLVISDYGKGVCTPELTARLIAAANRRAIPSIVDPKGTDWMKYAGATIVTPNLKELGRVMGVELKNEDATVDAAGRDAITRFGLKTLLVTRSERGMTLLSPDGGCLHVPVEAREVFDVSGAGDTVVATLAVALASGIDMPHAVKLSNKAAAIVVGKSGTAPIEYEELMDSARGASRKRMTLERLISRAAEHRRGGDKIVFTNGCFDILHRGHVSLLREAKKLGDVLVVGINSDRSVRSLKGEGRPVNTEEDRVELLAGLEFVDYVVVFDEETPENILRALRPEVLVKGGNYAVEQVVGREFAGRTVIVPMLEGYSTTRIISAIREDT